MFGEASENKVLVTDSNNDISGLRNINASGVITADSFAGCSWAMALVSQE